MSLTQASPSSLDMCDVAYNILTKLGWKAGERLSISGIGLRKPLGDTGGDGEDYQTLAKRVGILLEGQCDSSMTCEEEGCM